MTATRKYYLIRCTASGAVMAGAFLSSVAWIYVWSVFGSKFGKYLAEQHKAQVAA